MAGFFKSIFGRTPPPSPRSGSRLLDALQGYPANPPPFLGYKMLSDPQRDANLAHLIATVPDRMDALTVLLRGFGIDPAALLDSSAPIAGTPLIAAQAIDDWLTAELPERADLPPAPAENAPYSAFMDSDRSGNDIIFSLIADLGVFEGEAMRRRDGRFTWAIDRERGHRTLEVYRRLCLFKAAEPDWAATAIDFELRTLGIVYERRRTGAIHRFGDDLAALARGAFDASPSGIY